MRRPVRYAALAAGLAIAMSSVPASAQDENIEMSYRNWFHAAAMEEIWDGYIDSYIEEHPEINAITPQTIPFPRYNDVLTIEIAGNRGPDVAWINASVGPQWVKSGRLVDLKPLVPEGYDLDDFGGALAPWTDGDALYALPFTNAGNYLFFNKDVFEASGVTDPITHLENGTWTWDTVADTARQLKDAGVVDYGFHHNNNIFVNGWRILVDLYNAYGAGPWTVDGSQCTFDSPETLEATQLIYDMIYKDQTHPGPGDLVAFPAGNIGMSLGRQDAANTAAFQAAEFEWDVVPPPSGPAGFVPSLAQNGVVAFADGDNPELAGGFVLHAMNQENAAKFGVQTPAVRKSLQTTEILSANSPNYTLEQLERAILPVLRAEDFRMEYFHENYTPANAAAQLIFDGQIWAPDKTPEDIAASLGAICDAIDVMMVQ